MNRLYAFSACPVTASHVTVASRYSSMACSPSPPLKNRVFRTLTIGDVLEGFMDNMSQEQIDEELKLFDRIGRELLGQDKDYTECGGVIDECIRDSALYRYLVQTHAVFLPCLLKRICPYDHAT